MGKKHKKESKKRKHRSRSRSKSADKDFEKEKRKHHKRHHKDKKQREKFQKKDDYSTNSDDDVVYVPPAKVVKLSEKSLSPPLTPPVPKLPEQCAQVSSSSAAAASGSSNSENILSIAETNALRAKLGLKPLALPNDPSTNDPSQPVKEDFVHKPAENIMDKKLSEKLRNKISERKAKRELEKKLATIKTLGEESDDESTVNWIKKNRKLSEARMKAELKAKELDEMDEVFGIGELVEEEMIKEKTAAYTSANLRGLRVEHDVETFTEGKSVILTLKDRDILEEESDALVNVNMLDDERYKKNIFNKSQKPFAYNGIDSGEVEDDENKGVLSKYDDEIEGEKKVKAAFTIGEENLAAKKESIKRALKQKSNMRLESLAIPELKPANEYFTRDELIKIKKPRKKKKMRKLKADDLLRDSTQLPQDLKPPKSNIKVETAKEESDGFMEVEESGVMIRDVKTEEEEDSYLKRAIKKAMKLKTTPANELNSRLPKVEEVLVQIKEEPVDLGSTIVLNSTAEFCRTLGDIPTYGMAGNRDEEPNILLDFERDKNKSKKKQEVTDDRGGWNDVEMDEKIVEVKQVEAPILDAEPDLGSGVAGALRLAVSKGYLEKETSNRPSASRFSHLAAQNYSIDDKAHAVEDEKLGRRERYLGPTSDFKEKDGYKPNIKLEYIDDDGHLLSAKEAFRYLSHKFHGKGPGKNKVEKRMKKNEQEGLMKQMSSTDTPLGTLQMLQHKQKETQSAFVVLSGNKQLNTPTSISKTKMMK